MRTRIVVLFVLILSIGCTNTKEISRDVQAMTAAELALAVRQGQLTSTDIVDYYLARIEESRTSGRTLNAVILLDPTAREQARRLDQMFENGQLAGRLHGVPVLVKDTIDVAGLATTAGSLALSANVATTDAEVVARLRDEGAVILGKTNLSEWSNFRSRQAPAGWSAVGGQTINPFSPNHSPCGSSSGSAVAVAAGFSPLALGAETNASLICPGAVNGIVAFKPTVGSLSREGMILVSDSQDTPGPMARDVADIALTLEIMETAWHSGASPGRDLSDALDANLQDVRIGVFRWAEGGHPDVSAAFNDAIGILRSTGARLVDISDFDPDPVMWQHSEKVLLTEFTRNLEVYLSTTPAAVRVRTIEDLVDFNRDEPAEQTAEYGQDILERALESSAVSAAEHRESVDAIQAAAGRNGIDHLLTKHNVDVLIMPAAPPAAPKIRDPETASLRRNIGATWLPAMAGYPMLTVPMGATSDGLPLGLGIVGTDGDDMRVLQVGHAFEQEADIKLRPE